MRLCVLQWANMTERVLNPDFLKYVQQLPPDYSSDTNKALYRAFVRAFGTSVITSITLGGAIEMTARFKTALVDDGYSHEKLSANIKSDFNRGLDGLCGTPDPIDKTYTFVDPVG